MLKVCWSPLYYDDGVKKGGEENDMQTIILYF